MGYGETARQDGLGAALERARAATRSEGGGSPDALSVSGAMALAKGALEGVTVRLVGEVSEVSNKPGYKAVYFLSLIHIFPRIGRIPRTCPRR